MFSIVLADFALPRRLSSIFCAVRRQPSIQQLPLVLSIRLPLEYLSMMSRLDVVCVYLFSNLFTGQMVEITWDCKSADRPRIPAHSQEQSRNDTRDVVLLAAA